MAYLKLDKNILESSLWLDPIQTKVFLTALLIAERVTLSNAVTSLHPIPFEPDENYDPQSLVDTSLEIPPGEYGIVRASLSGLLRRACLDNDLGRDAALALCSPDRDSRTDKFEGRRMVRVSGGFLVLNYADHQDKDHSNAARQRRFREKTKACNGVTPLRSNEIVTVTHKEEEEEKEGKAHARDYADHQDKDHSNAARQRRFREKTKACNGVTPLRRNEIVTVTHKEEEKEEEKEKEKEKEKEGKAHAREGRIAPAMRGKAARSPSAPSRPDDVPDEVWNDWLALRKNKRAPVTATVLAGARAEAEKAGMSLADFLREWCTRGSQGLKAEWLRSRDSPAPQKPLVQGKDYI